MIFIKLTLKWDSFTDADQEFGNFDSYLNSEEEKEKYSKLKKDKTERPGHREQRSPPGHREQRSPPGHREQRSPRHKYGSVQDRTVETLVVVDKSMFWEHGRHNITTYVLSIFNIVSSSSVICG